MFQMIRFGLLFLSLLFTVQTWAAQSYCTFDAVPVGNYLQSDLLSDMDFKKAVACAVNRGGNDVVGHSSFRANYHLRMDEADLNTVHVLGRHSNREPLFNQKNLYSISFQGVYENRILTRVACEAAVEIQTVPEKHVSISLTNCRANAFGASRELPLKALAAYVQIK